MMLWELECDLGLIISHVYGNYQMGFTNPLIVIALCPCLDVIVDVIIIIIITIGRSLGWLDYKNILLSACSQTAKDVLYVA